MRTRTIVGLGTVASVLLLAGCSSSSSSPTTTTTTSTTTTTTTTIPVTAVTGAASPQALGAAFATALTSPSTFCTTYAVPDQVTACASDLAQGGVTLKDWKVGNVDTVGDQAVVTFTGTACQGSQCISNTDPNAATDPESAIYAGSTFTTVFATANDPNNQNNSPFVAAAVQQNGRWYASGF